MRAGMGPDGYRAALSSFTGVLEQQDAGGEPEYLPTVATHTIQELPITLKRRGA